MTQVPRKALRTRMVDSIQRKQITEALRAMGLKDRKPTRNFNGRQIVCGRFWSQPYGVLYDTLKLAKQRYRRLSKQYHPDYGGTERQMARLNLLWERIEYLFEKRGIALN